MCTYTIHRASENLRTTRITVSRKKRCAIKRNYRILVSPASPVTVTIESLESPLRFTENRFYSFPSPFPFLLPVFPSVAEEDKEKEVDIAFFLADKYAGHDACFGSDICFRIESSPSHCAETPSPVSLPFPPNPVRPRAVLRVLAPLSSPYMIHEAHSSAIRWHDTHPATVP